MVYKKHCCFWNKLNLFNNNKKLILIQVKTIPKDISKDSDTVALFIGKDHNNDGLCLYYRVGFISKNFQNKLK